MPKGHLMDSQVRDVEAAVQGSGFLGRDFVWEERDGQWWTGYADLELPTLVYMLDPSFFFSFEHHPLFTTPEGFYHDPGAHQVYFKPGRETPTEHQRQLTWEKVRAALHQWLSYVAREKGIVFPDPEPDPVPEPIPDTAKAPTPPPAPTAHEQRERVLGSTINGWLEREAERRGRFWTVVAQTLGLILAVDALILTALAL